MVTWVLHVTSLLVQGLFHKGSYWLYCGLQMYCDPEAADITFTSGMNILVTGIDLTTQVLFTGECLFTIRDWA
jgi:hypothetical protein